MKNQQFSVTGASLTEPERRRVRQIQIVVAQHFKITVPQMLAAGNTRDPKFVQPRQVAMHIARWGVGLHHPALAECFGRSSDTVGKSLRALREYIARDPTLSEEVQRLEGLLSDLPHPSADDMPPPITIEDIQKKVAEHFNIRLADMHSARRARAVARPRQVAMYLAKQLTPRSLPEIGRKFGNRDHTTVMFGISAVSARMAADKGYTRQVEALRELLERPLPPPREAPSETPPPAAKPG